MGAARTDALTGVNALSSGLHNKVDAYSLRIRAIRSCTSIVSHQQVFH
jgi:hypothetical protein